MKKNILIALIAFLAIGISSVNARTDTRAKSLVLKSTKTVKSLSKLKFDQTLVSSVYIVEHCSNGTEYVTLGLVWRNNDGSIEIQNLHFGVECPIEPPQP